MVKNWMQMSQEIWANQFPLNTVHLYLHIKFNYFMSFKALLPLPVLITWCKINSFQLADSLPSFVYICARVCVCACTS